MSSHPNRRQLLALAAATAASGSAWSADSFASGKPVQLVIPYAPGGLTDSIGRLFATKLKEHWADTVVVDNRPGAGATLGAGYVARAAADGHTLLLGSVGMSTNQYLLKSLPYKPGDLAASALVASAPNVLYVHPSVPATNVRELVAYAKSKPGTLSFASSGIGSSPHLAAALFAARAGIEVLHVPYKGTGAAISDFLGGQVNCYFDTMQSMQYAREGKIRALAVTTEKRLAQASDLPTVEESGVAPGVVSSSWFGFFVPSKMDAALQNEVSRALLAVAGQRDAQDKLSAMGVIPEAVGPAAFSTFVKKESDKWGEVIRANRISVD